MPAETPSGLPYPIPSDAVAELPTTFETFARMIEQVLIPVGTITAYAHKYGGAPTGWLVCDGSEVTSEQFPDLAAVLCGMYLPPTFALPDLRGRFIVGTGEGDGLTNRAPLERGGHEDMAAHTHTIHNAGYHSHSVWHGDQVYQGTGPGTWPQGNNGVNGYGASNQPHGVSGDGDHSHAMAAAGTGNAGNMPPYIALTYIIRHGGK
jgi:microcystin-dependent protein